MTPYTHDVESLVMKWDELAEFGKIVREETSPSAQHCVSELFSQVKSAATPWAPFLICRAENMWQRGVKVPEEGSDR